MISRNNSDLWSTRTSIYHLIYTILVNVTVPLPLMFGLLLIPVSANSAAWKAQQLMDFTAKACLFWEETAELATGATIGPAEISRIEVRGKQIGVKHRVPVDHQSYLELDVIGRVGQQPQFVSTLYRAGGDPLLLVSLSSDCSLRAARKIIYTERGHALNIVSLDENFVATGEPEWLNPSLIFAERDSPESLIQSNAELLPIRVGMVDSGVNYQIPLINLHLARDSNYRLIGYDFWDMDGLPYDAHPLRSDFFVQRHGTRTASLLLREAPGIELVPYRYPRPDMSRMQALVEHADSHRVAILGMPLGSNRAEEWKAFEQAARAHPDMLFIVSAGNNGRDIDDQPVYPAALDLDNMLVVTSADDFLFPAERTNWGKKSVDYLIPAEKIALIDYSGEEIKASGSSYAVSRMTALAAKLKMAHRQWTAADILAELRKRYSNNSVLDWVSTGYIGDPLAGGRPVQLKLLPDLNIGRIKGNLTALKLPLDILILDPRWNYQRIEQTVQKAYDILGQCGITIGDISIHSFEGEDYLRDLSTGGSRTLLEAASMTNLRVVFARDTRMLNPFTGEAFGLGNTRKRPWLSNSVWLMLDIEDTGFALAHELYHVISNSGEHVEGSENLMQSRTDVDNLALTTQQCQRAQVNGLANKLLQDNRTQ